MTPNIEIDLLIKENQGRKTAQQKTRNAKMWGTERACKVPIEDFIGSGMINEMNMKNP